MRAKTLIELLTLSTNIYMISKDEEFMENLSEMIKKGKKKAEDFVDDFTGKEDEEKYIQKLLHKIKTAKEEMEKKIEETAVNVYRKMHIAHTNEVKKLADEIEQLKRELAIAESRIVNLEPKQA